jgi:serine/threonine-protein kinase SRPK3
VVPLPFSAISVADKQSSPDLTTSNILFSLSPRVIEWSDAEVYAHLGEPETEEVETYNDEKPPVVHAPAMLVEPIQNSRISHSSLIQEDTIISGFNLSTYQPGTLLNYLPPETRFLWGTCGLEADIWMLGCAIFEIRAGFPLFESFMGSDVGF